MNIAAKLTLATGSFSNYFFSMFPISPVCFGAIATRPMWMVYSMQSKLGPPCSGAFMTTKMMCPIFFEITRCPLKFLAAIVARFFNPVFGARSPRRAFIIARPGAILSFVTNEVGKDITANKASLVFLANIVFPSHNTKIYNINEIDKDYYEAAVKRFRVHTMQYQMF